MSESKPEKLRVLDLFSGILLEGSPLDLNARAVLKPLHSARLRIFLAKY